MPAVADAPVPTSEPRVTRLEAELAATKARLAAAERERDEARQGLESLRKAYPRALEHLALLRRRLFVETAERVEACGEQLAFDALFAEVQRLEQALDDAERAAPAAAPEGEAGEPKRRRGGKGRATKRPPPAKYVDTNS
ncbi:MAG TPA: hypothetical protein VFS43_02325 [Polyangiaceae bacterium]|nr:hypothetical protein [Polyangiaceae bacterium]